MADAMARAVAGGGLGPSLRQRPARCSKEGQKAQRPRAVVRAQREPVPDHRPQSKRASAGRCTPSVPTRPAALHHGVHHREVPGRREREFASSSLRGSLFHVAGGGAVGALDAVPGPRIKGLVTHRLIAEALAREGAGVDAGAKGAAKEIGQSNGASSEAGKQGETALATREPAGEAALPPHEELRWSDVVSAEVAEEVTRRLQRLEVLMLVRRLYRDVARSERVVRIPIPRIAKETQGTQELKVRRRTRRGVNDWLRRVLEGDMVLGGRFDLDDDEAAPEPLVFDSASEVLDFAEDIQELALSLKSDMLRLQDRLPTVFPSNTDVASKVRSTVEMLEEQLQGLARRIEQSLTPEDRAAAEQEKEQERLLRDENVQARVLRRLEGLSTTGQAVLGEVVGQRFAGVGQGLSQINLADSFTTLSLIQDAKQAGSSALQTLGDLWRRLNGLPEACDLEPLAAGLPRPQSALGEEEEKKVALLLQVESLDKKLTEASRSRETRLRQRNSLLTTKTRLLAAEIRALDDEVNDIRKQLMVRALQLEMQLIYMAIEAELLLANSIRDTRTDEDEALLIAEFGLLDTDLARLRAAVDRQEAILIDDEELDVLTRDIPDLKQRLGIVEAPTVPLSQRVQLTLQDTQSKVSEGSTFLWRGLRLLGGDISYSLRLFWVAANGATLKAREVQTLRRTAQDILVIVPFTIIMLAPITPVGHVVVFSFLQKYFPGFFPSSFSSRRQEVMKRYEVLRQELESGSAFNATDKERAIAAAAAETFEAREEDEGQGANGASRGGQGIRWLLPVFGSRKDEIPGGPESFARSARVLRDDPQKLRLLQEKLPGISSLLADLKARESQRTQASLPQADDAQN